MNLRIFALLTVLIVAAGCTSQPDPAPVVQAAKPAGGNVATDSRRPTTAGPTAARADGDKSGPVVTSQEQCSKLGGTWRRAGLMQLEVCDVPTKDAGKACRDSSECESLCVAPDGANASQASAGQCYKSFLTVGKCLSIVANGRISTAQCSD